MSDAIAPGLTGEAERTVTTDLLASSMGSGDVRVLATPALLAMMEEAAVTAVRDALAGGTTSVGTWVDLDHLAPSRIGARVRAVARLERVDGKRLEFTCEAFDGDTLVGRARHRRAIVDRARFDG
jgi:fluoroacetyl-CoA thioesterase